MVAEGEVLIEEVVQVEIVEVQVLEVQAVECVEGEVLVEQVVEVEVQVELVEVQIEVEVLDVVQIQTAERTGESGGVDGVEAGLHGGIDLGHEGVDVGGVDRRGAGVGSHGVEGGFAGGNGCFPGLGVLFDVGFEVVEEGVDLVVGELHLLAVDREGDGGVDAVEIVVGGVDVVVHAVVRRVVGVIGGGDGGGGGVGLGGELGVGGRLVVLHDDDGGFAHVGEEGDVDDAGRVGAGDARRGQTAGEDEFPGRGCDEGSEGGKQGFSPGGVRSRTCAHGYGSEVVYDVAGGGVGDVHPTDRHERLQRVARLDRAAGMGSLGELGEHGVQAGLGAGLVVVVVGGRCVHLTRDIVRVGHRDTTSGEIVRRRVASARRCIALTAVRGLPRAAAVSSRERSATKRRTTSSRCSSVS